MPATMPMKPLRIPRRLARGRLGVWLRAAMVPLAIGMILLVADSLLARSLRETVLATTEASNQTLARVFVNDHWKELSEQVLAARPAAELGNALATDAIDRRIRSFARGTDVLKIKIYGPSGLTLYSTDPAQIGENKADNPGVLGALKGLVSSELGHRGTIGAFDGDRHDRDLVSSYLPVRGPQGIEAVLEIYVDRTTAVEAIDSRRTWLAGWLTLALVAGTVTLRMRALRRREEARRLRVRLREAGRRHRHNRRELADVRDRAAALLAQAGVELGAPIRQLLAQARDDAASADPDAPAGPLSLANLQLQACRFDGLAAMADRGAAPQDGAIETVKLGPIVDAVLAARRTQAEALRCTLTAHVDPRLAHRDIGDPRRLRDAIELLVACTIGLSPSGRVQLKVQAHPDGACIGITDSARNPLSAPSLDRMIASSLIDSLGGCLRTQFTPGAGHWHHFTIGLPAPADAGLAAKDGAMRR
jgi:hypothetical protein